MSDIFYSNNFDKFLSDLYANERVEELDLFSLLRHIDAKSKKSRIGYSKTPRDDDFRLGQNPSTIFAPSTIFSINQKRLNNKPLIKILSFGVLGPNGALPIHLTEYIYERLHHSGDSSPSDFIDIFHHRLISLFYRAWSDSRSIVQLDRPGIDNFSFYVGSLIGMGFDSSWNRDSIEDTAKLCGSGHFIRLTRNPEGLENLISLYFKIPANIVEFQKRWISLDLKDRSFLSKNKINNKLGVDFVVGSKVLDIQSKFRICLGPMSLKLFRTFFPKKINNIKIRDWVRSYIGIEFEWDLQLLLEAKEVPKFELGKSSQLGWTTWLGKRKSLLPAKDLIVRPE